MAVELNSEIVIELMYHQQCMKVDVRNMYDKSPTKSYRVQSEECTIQS